MSALDLFLSRVDSPRSNGKDRWRCSCPVCGGRNPSTLSIGVTDQGAVLLKCFKDGCGPGEIATALGLTIENLFPPRDSSGPPLRRRRLISATQVVDALEVEFELVWTAAFNLANGHALTSGDLSRLSTAGQRIRSLVQESRS
jgi:hypothetical protein